MVLESISVTETFNIDPFTLYYRSPCNQAVIFV